jgi:hypothetical protein
MDDPLMDALNNLIANDPTLRELFPVTYSPSYRYWELKKGEAHNRYARQYCYTTKRANGPDGGKAGFWAMVYEVHPVPNGQTLKLKRACRSRRRKDARARAYRWYQRARGQPVTSTEVA